MGVSVPGAQRGRSGNFELNLVPFIDLLSVCITFLLSTAVLIEIHNLQVDQSVADAEEIHPVQPKPMLTVYLAVDGVRVGRDAEALVALPLLASGYPWDRVAAELERDRVENADEKTVIVQADDGVDYGDLIRAIDLARGHGYANALLAGGSSAP
jgi:biopolymer transport protein ExbD